MTEHEGFVIPEVLVRKIATEVTVSRSLLGQLADEQSDADRARWHAERVEAWRLYDAARPALAAITDPLARAVLDLHHADTVEHPQCQGCEFDGYDAEPPAWPCATVRIVADRFGIRLPDGAYDLYHRPEETA